MRHDAWFAAIGLIGLAVLGCTYWYSYEPAPGIRVTWAKGVTAERQATLERKYLLANPRSPHPEEARSLAYDLLDTSHDNIAALLTDPAVIDTNDIDDQWARVRLGTAYGDEWMWIADRTPVLRNHRVRSLLVTMLAASAILGLFGMLRRRHA